MEAFLSVHPDTVLMFSEADPAVDKRAVKNLIGRCASHLHEVVWETADFKRCEDPDDADEGGVASHSYRKFPCTKARHMGLPADDTEIRGRWRETRGRIVHRYIDIKQLFIDAKVAAVLSCGGPIAYEVRAHMKEVVTQEWIDQYVIPHIAAKFPNDARLREALGTALLWKFYDEYLKVLELQDTDHPHPNWLPYQKIKEVCYPLFHLLDEEFDRDPETDLHVNPVVKVPLEVCRVEDRMVVRRHAPLVEGAQQDAVVVNQGQAPPPYSETALRGVATDTAYAVVQGAGQSSASREELRMMRTDLSNLAEVVSINQTQTVGAINNLRTHIDMRFEVCNSNIRRFAGTLPGAVARSANRTVRQAAGQEVQEREIAEGDGEGSATLSPRPKTLQDLWNEYKFGIGGRKPTEQWTERERGNTRNGIKQKYYRRKVVWWMIDTLVRQGHTVNNAIYTIRGAFGVRCSVTQIINKALFARQHNRWPDQLSSLQGARPLPV
jgi:hypothetical protein